MNPHLARIRLFPVKSLDGQDVTEAVIMRSGALWHDREYCLLDSRGDFLNGKRLGERIVAIRSEVDFAFGELHVSAGRARATFQLERDRKGIEKWFGRRFRSAVRLAHDPEKGFPDDTDAPGPTVISTATLRQVCSWFPGLTEDEARRRFRANLEIDGVPPFWEDRLYGPAHETCRFRIGAITLEGVNPCARCTVPSRDSFTGKVTDSAFAKKFAEQRRQSLPDWAEGSRFDHFYRLAVNTRVPETEAGKTLHRLDEVDLLDPPA